jgi:hypothetical protein
VSPVTLVEDVFGEGSFEQFLHDYHDAARGEYEPMRRWGVDVSVRALVESGLTLPQLVAMQLRNLEP